MNHTETPASKQYHLTRTTCCGLYVTEYIPIRGEQEQREYHESVTEQCLQIVKAHDGKSE